MELNYSIKKKIWSIVNCMEMGVPYFKYDDYTVLPDGPNGIKQYTASLGFTEYGGNLKKVIDRYISKKGKYIDRLLPYQNRIGKMPSLAGDKNFITNMVFVSKNDQAMKDAQDEIFEEVYFNPALKWAETEGIKTNLGILTVYDSFLHSGQIFTFLRNKFKERTPSHGGDEKKWITAYLQARLNWLENHSNSAVRSSAYRVRTYLKLIEKNNWDLVGPITTLNGCNCI
jgi:chitosanase